MKILTFSDSHFTERNFNPQIYDTLVTTINGVDNVVLNGDIWDGFITTFDKFVNSEWQKLFPLLKAKDTFYVYGNHDRADLSDSRVNQFSVEQGKVLDLEIDNTKLHFEHGNRLTPSLEETYFFFRNQFSYNLGDWIKQTGTKIFGTKYFYLSAHLNDRMMKYKRNHMDNATYLITGHSHFQEINPDVNFYNSGIVNHLAVQYLIIDTKIGEVKPVSKLF